MLRRKIMAFFVAFTMFLVSGKMGIALATDPFSGCASAPSGGPQVNTALGCVPVEMGDFIGWLLPKMFGIVGGISFLLMVYGFIIIATSAGDPKKVQGGKETVTSAITGLLVSIFSLFILRLIAVNILHIPGIN